MKAIFLLISALMIGSVGSNKYINENSANCDAELSVENNNNSKPVGENGTKFSLTLKNTSLSTVTYKLSVNNLQETCENITKKSSGNNVTLITSFKLNNADSSQNEITLNSGQSVKFNIKVYVPASALNNDWGCVEIEAKPIGCSSSNVKTVLSVYVPELSVD